ncbi:DUF3891 family protein [Virgibacillus siamensis]|uniref:DUF3891 family protein n=1 Tax=Virgibacillus siamensis TaxID=480071 RepID=UPI0009861C9C|nr:DUF3891 family protein [Virgibacillus siamensis]
MIIREHTNEFIMIEQDDHAHLSGKFLQNWKDNLFNGKQMRESVEKAVHHHDLGWKMLDKQPFWNDAKLAPYTFVDFPLLPKTVFYKHGIEEVIKMDLYAGLLCSRHYTNFLLGDDSQEARQFVRDEQNRQRDIKKSLSFFETELYDLHYGYLQFCDSLSLYVCLNEPGITKANEHPFFQEGIPIAYLQKLFGKETVQANWTDNNTIKINPFPFAKPFMITIKYKCIAKGTIAEQGLLNSYQGTIPKTYDVLLTGKNV